jgi:DNA-binding GntR family transcriptional regulator
MSPTAPSRLQAELAGRILRLLKDQGAGPGHHLVELELCERFGVSRTPVRGALRLLAEKGAVAARAHRGFVLTGPIGDAPGFNGAGLEDAADPGRGDDEAAKRLLIAIAHTRNHGKLPDRFAQQEIIRRFGVRPGIAVRVLRELADLGLVVRQPGNGWAFGADAQKAQNESYAFRRAVEPAMLLQPSFKLDRGWLEKARSQHVKFRRKPWRDGDAADFYEVNADFHEQLARCSGNRYMLGAVERQNRLRRFLANQIEYNAKRVLAAIDEHLEILTALESGWNDKAAALMLHHLTISATPTAPSVAGVAGALEGAS